MIAEHREHRNLELTAGVGDHLRLLGLTGCRQIAGEEDHIRFLGDGRECALDALARRLGRMQVARSSDADHAVDVAQNG